MHSVLIVVVKPLQLGGDLATRWQELLKALPEKLAKTPEFEFLGETTLVLSLRHGPQAMQTALSVLALYPFEHRLLFIKDESDWVVAKTPANPPQLRLERF